MTSKIKFKMTMTAAEQVAGNKYLLEEILIRLPPKPATRSKLVSKQWLSQISDPQFVQRHSQHSSPNHKFCTGMFVTDRAFISRNTDFDFVSFNVLDPTYQTIPSLGFLYDALARQLTEDEVSEIEIMDSCNGLILCSVKYAHLYCVCNPTTKTFRLLPAGPVHYGPGRTCTGYLAFDPSVSPHYKVISIRKRLDLCLKLDIYSSKDGLWKNFDPPIHPSSGEGFFLNGSMFWLSNGRSFCFDVDNEEMKPLNLLADFPNPCLWKNLYTVGSHFYYIERKGDDGETPDFCVGAMTSDLSQWITKYDASVCPLLSAFPQMTILDEYGWPEFAEICKFCFSVIYVAEGVKDDEVQLVLGIPGKLLLYNLKEKTAKELCDLHGELGDEGGYSSVRVFQFIETLSIV